MGSRVKRIKNTTRGDKMKMKYRAHRFDIKMARDQGKLEQFLNNLEGEVVSIVPNIAMQVFGSTM